MDERPAKGRTRYYSQSTAEPSSPGHCAIDGVTHPFANRHANYKNGCRAFFAYQPAIGRSQRPVVPSGGVLMMLLVLSRLPHSMVEDGVPHSSL